MRVSLSSRRKFIRNGLLGASALTMGGRVYGLGGKKAKPGNVMTVTGRIRPKELGKTLIHEHILVDFIGAAKTGYHRWDKEKVIEKMAPYLIEIKERGYDTLVDCTPAFLGRDPVMLKAISEQTGINILTNTGIYGAVDNKFVPEFAKKETARQLADRWVKEFDEGIEGTGVRPGFIKTSVNKGPLSELHKKLVTAAGLTHLETGLTIASHTGPAVPALKQLDVLEAIGVKGNAFIWVHAQNETDNENYRLAAERGAWISIEGMREKNVEERIEKLIWLKNEKLLKNTLVSHDAGWYDPEKPGGENITGFTLIADVVAPELKRRGFTDGDLELLFVDNPVKAFATL